MIASHVSERALKHAALSVGVEIQMHPLSSTKRRWQVKLFPLTQPEMYMPSGRRRKGAAGDAKYQRESASYFRGEHPRRVHAVCWHGFRDFFRAVYSVEPEAKFYTALAKWLGSEHFESTYRDSYYKNIGASISPVYAGEACRCAEGK